MFCKYGYYISVLHAHNVIGRFPYLRYAFTSNARFFTDKCAEKSVFVNVHGDIVACISFQISSVVQTTVTSQNIWQWNWKFLHVPVTGFGKMITEGIIHTQKIKNKKNAKINGYRFLFFFFKVGEKDDGFHQSFIMFQNDGTYSSCVFIHRQGKMLYDLETLSATNMQ